MSHQSVNELTPHGILHMLLARIVELDAEIEKINIKREAEINIKEKYKEKIFLEIAELRRANIFTYEEEKAIADTEDNLRYGTEINRPWELGELCQFLAFILRRTKNKSVDFGSNAVQLIIKTCTPLLKKLIVLLQPKPEEDFFARYAYQDGIRETAWDVHEKVEGGSTRKTNRKRSIRR